MKKLLLWVVAAFVISLQASNTAVLAESSPHLVVKHVQTRSASSASDELIEVFNNSTEVVDITNWCVKYSSANSESFSRTTCLNSSEIGFEHRIIIGGRASILLTSTVFNDNNPSFSSHYSFSAGMADGGGRVAIFDQNNQMIDAVAWGTSVNTAEGGMPAPALTSALPVLERKTTESGALQDTNNSQDDFIAIAPPSSYEVVPLLEATDFCLNVPYFQTATPDGTTRDETTGECTETTEEDPPVDPEIDVCAELVDVVQLNEILPNPSGSDSGNEFIELANKSGEEVVLDGCLLQVDDKSPVSLDGLTIGPNGWLAIYNDKLDFTLPNGAGGTVYLLSTDNEMDSANYPGDMKDDQTFARFKSGWKATYSSTPNESNIWQEFLPCAAGQERNSETGRCTTIQVESELQPCAVNQFRNPETNRCKLFNSSTSSLVPCAPHQYRNLETNRCRLIASSSSMLIPCAANQYRNPATNRCRLISSSTSSLKPCAPNQARNPETNRCRKVISSDVPAAAFAIEPVKETGKAFAGWWALGGVGTLAAGYGAWEWRREAMNAIRKIAGVLFSSK